MAQGRAERWAVDAALVLGAALALLVLVHSATLPLWGDDYRHLFEAVRAREGGQPWWWPLVEPLRDKFWRPLGEDMFWRFVAGPLHADPRLAHGVLIALWATSAVAAGLAAAQAARILMPEAPVRRAAAVAALLYAAQGPHGLTLGWLSAANSLMANALVGLALACWLAAWQRRDGSASAMSALALAAFALSLLCREIGIVAPALAVVLAVPLWANAGPARRVIVRDVLASIAVAAAWWWLRSGHVVDEERGYALALGGNVPANGVALGLFGLNMPREALRFLMQQPSLPVVGWALVCVGLQAASLVLLWRALPAERRRQVGIVSAAVAAIGCSPYLLLSGQSYPYYLGVALLGIAVLAAAGAADRRWKPALALALLGSALANGGEHWLPQPALYARAIWADRSLQQLAALAREYPAHFSGTLIVHVENDRDFYAIGQWGVAMRTGMPAESVHVDYPCAPGVNAVRFSREAPPQLFRC